MSGHGPDDEWAGLARAAEERHRVADDAWVGDVLGRVRRGRRVRAAGVAGATLAVVAAAVVGASTLGAPGRAAPPPATRSTESAGPVPTSPVPDVAPTPVPDEVGGVHEFADLVVTGAVAWRGAVVAVGCDEAATTNGDAIDLPVFVGSGDAWQRADGVTVRGGAPVTCVDSVAATADGLVLVAGSAVLRSDDGLVWTPVVLPDDGNGWYSAVVAVGDRVTVVASRAAEAESRVATLWTSTDTRAWERVGSGPWPRPSAGQGDDPAVVFDSADVAERARLGTTTVLVGASPGGEFVPTAAAWTSADGLDWRPATVDQGADCSMSAVVPWRGGLAAAGWCPESGEPALWTSADGTAWTRVAAPEPLGPRSTGWTEVLALTVAGDELVIAGADHGDGIEGAARVQWVGTPEAGWERHDDLAVGFHEVAGNGFWPAVGPGPGTSAG